MAYEDLKEEFKFSTNENNQQGYILANNIVDFKYTHSITDQTLLYRAAASNHVYDIPAHISDWYIVLF